jgi:hypothetical protein
MPRRLERICLEDGLKLDLNFLFRQNVVRAGATGRSTIVWGHRYLDEQIASGFAYADMTDVRSGWFRIELGALEQRMGLEAVPRHFGGRQWYFRCPTTKRRVSVLGSPATHKASPVGKLGARKSPMVRNSRPRVIAPYPPRNTFVIGSAETITCHS